MGLSADEVYDRAKRWDCRQMKCTTVHRDGLSADDVYDRAKRWDCRLMKCTTVHRDGLSADDVYDRAKRWDCRLMKCRTVLHGGVCHRTSTPHHANKMKKKNWMVLCSSGRRRNCFILLFRATAVFNTV